MALNTQIHQNGFATIVMFVGLALISCKKESASCHYSLRVRNAGSAPVVYAVTGSYDSQCFITTKSNIRPSEIYEDKRNECWENILAEGDFEFQFMEVSSRPIGISVACDSAATEQKILQKYRITDKELPYLEQNNFQINFIDL